MKRRVFTGLLVLLVSFGASASADVIAQTTSVIEWKSVFGKIETRDRIPARSRLGGILQAIDVVEGTTVVAGDVIATVTDQKLDIQLGAMDAQLQSLAAQLKNAETELARGENLLERGVTTAQRLDSLRTEVDVLNGRIAVTTAERNVVVRRSEEGAVLAPITGTVLNVPVAPGSFVLPGEAIAEIGGGGFFLRLAVPERHAAFLAEGAEIRIGTDSMEGVGRLAKIYPLIENGRVIADVEVEGLPTGFVDARVLVRLPVGETDVFLVPEASVTSRMGLDFVSVAAADGTASQRAVVLGERHDVDGTPMIEILSGLRAGEILAISHE